MSRKLEVINKLAMDIVNDTTESYRNADFNARKIVMLAQPRDFNDNQQIVLDWMKEKRPYNSIDNLFVELTFLNCTGGMLKNEKVALAYQKLDEVDLLEVIETFVSDELTRQT